MKQFAFAGVIALLSVTSLQAQGYGYAGGYAPGGGDYGAGTAWAGNGLGFINNRPSPFGLAPQGFLGLGFRMFAGIHQHGPLVNYGPYEGYYPFEPYGPWTKNIEYTGPMDAPRRRPAPEWNAHYGLLRPGELLGRERVHRLETRRYALDTYINVCSRINPFGHRHAGGCSTCGGARAGITGGASTLAAEVGAINPGLAAAPADAVRMVGLDMRDR